MIPIDLRLDGDGAMNDIAPENVVDCGTISRVILLKNGTASGAHSVSIVFDMPDGKKAIAQTSLKLLLMAAGAMQTRAEMDGAE